MKLEFRKPAALIAMVVVRILSMLIAFKYLSDKFGLEGFGFLSQVMAVSALFSTFAGGGLSSGLVKEIAGVSTDDDRASWLKSGLIVSAASAGILVAIAILLSLFGSRPIFNADGLAWVFLLIGGVQIGTGIGNTVIAYLSGVGAIRALVTSNILGSLISVFIVVGGTQLYGLTGAVVGCAALAFAPSICGLAIFSRAAPGQLRAAIGASHNRQKTSTLLQYSFAMVIAAAVVPLVLIFVRLRIGETDGWRTVGQWQAVARIGDAYVQVFGTLFVSLYLPRLAALPRSETFRAMIGFFPPILGLFIGGGLVFWIFADHILRLAYAPEFATAAIYVLPQLAADFLKILASFFVYRFMALGRPSVQAVGEVVQAGVMLLAFLALHDRLGGMAAVWSYVLGAGAVLIFVAVKTLVANQSEMRE